uniref:Secreted protein n=1 Tax=Caenorhabditis tropicalis TaxID=1561998 RepID=A0A1I7UPP4_9PELO
MIPPIWRIFEVLLFLVHCNFVLLPLLLSFHALRSLLFVDYIDCSRNIFQFSLYILVTSNCQQLPLKCIT